MTRGCQTCTRGRIEKARAAGLQDDVLNALVGVVSAVNAGVAAATARKVFVLQTHPRPTHARSLFRRFPQTLRNGPSYGERKNETQPEGRHDGEQQFVVERSHAIDFADGAMPAVLSTRG